jgi:hypothetical protein
MWIPQSIIDKIKSANTSAGQAVNDVLSKGIEDQVNPQAVGVMPKAGSDTAARAAPVARTTLSETNSAASKVYMKKGGKVSASKRADGIAKRGKTKGRMV